jgi:GNAT superfamily N-acetyltransferase
MAGLLFICHHPLKNIMHNNPVVIKELRDRKDLKEFVMLPSRIHRNHGNWVPPIYLDDFGFFNPRKNSSFSYCDHIRLIAYRSGKPVGRVMGLINHRYNERKNENNARFSYLETYEDQEVVHALLEYVENWARKLGAEKIVGPLGFSDKEPQGYMIEGFDNPISLATNCNLPYQVSLLENEGYTPEVNLLAYKTPISDTLPPVYQRVLPRLEKLNSEFRIKEPINRLELRRYIRPVLRLTNKAFEDIYGSMPYEDHEMTEFANRFIIFLNPHFVKIVEDSHGQVVAFVVGMSDISAGIRKAGGLVLPFGLFTMLRSGRQSNQLNLMLGAVEERYRGRGLDVMMALKLFKSARERGKTVMDSHLILEDNFKMRAEVERIGGEIYKRYRIFQKNLRD